MVDRKGDRDDAWIEIIMEEDWTGVIMDSGQAIIMKKASVIRDESGRGVYWGVAYITGRGKKKRASGSRCGAGMYRKYSCSGASFIVLTFPSVKKKSDRMISGDSFWMKKIMTNKKNQPINKYIKEK